MLDILIRAGSFVAIMVGGFVLRKLGFFKESDFTLLSKITLRITLPASIIVSFTGKTIQLELLTIALLGIGAGAVYVGLAWLLNLRKDRRKCAFEMLNFSGYNIGCFTMPFVNSFLGAEGVLTTSLFDTGNAFVCLGGAYSLAAMVQDGQGFSLKKILHALVRSVPFMTYVVMTVLCLAKLPLPGPVLSLAQVVAGANSFMAMLMLGVGFKLEADRVQILRALRVLAIRFGVAAVLAAVFYFLLPFSLGIRQALVLLVFSPIASAVPAFTAQLKGDTGFSSALNSLSILCSILCIITLLSVMRV